MNNIFRTAAFAFLVTVFACSAFSQSTQFSFQGSLKDGINPANGSYDFEFALFDSALGGNQFGPTLTRNAVVVTTGIFAVDLDFGAQFPGSARFLEIRVRLTGQGGITILAPRQSIGSSPYGVRSQTAATADIAASASDAAQLGGIAASQYVLTGDPRLSDARNPLPNSPNYIQNGTALQSTSNFNISGTGTASIFNANTQYNLNGGRFSGVFGSNNTFTGLGAGAALTTGASNSLFGRSVGVATTTGSNNSFFGITSGGTNITGGNNTAVGAGADMATSGLNFATAIGAGSVVSASNSVVLGRAADTVQIPGILNVTGSFGGNGSGLTNLNASAITTGTLNPLRLGNGAVLNGTTLQASANFNISGTGTASIFDAGSQFNLGGARILGNTGTNNLFAGIGAGAVNTGTENTFVGAAAGSLNAAGAQNSFFGKDAGQNNTTGIVNSFFGVFAGEANTSGPSNSFFGGAAGQANTTGGSNAFFGRDAGQANTIGNSNSYFGGNAGDANVDGSTNSFFGRNAGSIGTTGSNNAFFGFNAGAANRVDGNAFFGAQAGDSNTTGTGNAFFGTQAGTSNTTSSNNSFFGISAGQSNTSGISNAFFGRSAGFANTGGGGNSFFGAGAGQDNTSGIENSFFGAFAGAANTTANGNSFFGSSSGLANTTGFNNAMFGLDSGTANTTGNNNAFFGRNSGINNTTGTENTFIGSRAGVFSTEGINNTFVGVLAGQTNTLGDNNTVIGANADVNAASRAFATAIGAGTIVSSNNTIQLGRPVDTVIASGKLIVTTLAGGGQFGGTPICRNSTTLEISTCGISVAISPDSADFTSGLESILKLRPRVQNLGTDGSSEIGFTSDEAAQLHPSLVNRDGNGTAGGIRYDRVAVLLVNAVKEQQAQIDAQRQVIDQLKRKTEELDAIKVYICSQKPDAQFCKPQP